MHREGFKHPIHQLEGPGKYMIVRVNGEPVFRGGRSFAFHADIVEHIRQDFSDKKIIPEGGGFIEFLDQNHIKVCGESMRYGRERDRKSTVEILHNLYPKAEIEEA